MRCFNCTSENYASNKCNDCGFDNRSLKPNPSALTPGTILDDRYFIGRVLGQGGFGITYVGFDEILGGIVAIKEHYPKAIVQRSSNGEVLANNTSEYKAGLIKFTEEAKAVAKFKNHPNIVSVLSYMTSNNTAYMIMEYIQGRTVKEILANGKTLPVKDALEVIHQVLDGIGACHKARLIHRDLTPDNIYITTQGSIKILDFGSARETVEGGENEFTQVLKKSYAPVEQFQQGQGQGPWTDIYSIGASLYRMLVGKPPELNSVDRLLNDTLKSPLQLKKLKDWNQELDDALMKAMAVRPEFRYQHVDEFKVDLLNALDSYKDTTISQQNKNSVKSSGQSTQSVKPKHQDSFEKKSSSNSKLIPIIGSAAAAVILGVFMFSNSEPSKSTSTIAQRTPLSESLPSLVNQAEPSIPQKEISPPPTKPNTQEQRIAENINRRPPDPITEPIQKQELIPPSSTSPSTKLVSLITNPSSAKIFIDNKLVSDTESYPATSKEVNIKVIASGYKTYETDAIISSTKRYTLKQYQNPTVSLYSLLVNYVEAPSNDNAMEFKQALQKNHASFVDLSKLVQLMDGDNPVKDELNFLAKNGDLEAEFILQLYYLNDPNKRNDVVALDRLKLSKTSYPLASLLFSTYKGCLLEAEISCDTKAATAAIPDSPSLNELSSLMQAMLFLKADRISDAESKLKLVKSSSSLATNLLGEIYYRKGDVNAAIAEFRKAATQDDLVNTSALINLGIVSGNAKDKNKWIYDAANMGSLKAQKMMPYVSLNYNNSVFLSSVNKLMQENKSEASMLMALYHYNLNPSNSKEINTYLSSCNLDINCKFIKTLLSPVTKSSFSSSDLDSKEVLPTLKAQALNKLGRSLLADEPTLGIKHLEAAKSLGSRDSIAALCYAYAYISVDESKAIQECERGFDLNIEDPLLLNTLSYMYTSRDIFKKIPSSKSSRAKSIMIKSCNLGSGAACCNASKLENNPSSKQDYLSQARQKGVLEC